jgi:hypothetical protein
MYPKIVTPNLRLSLFITDDRTIQDNKITKVISVIKFAIVALYSPFTTFLRTKYSAIMVIRKFAMEIPYKPEYPENGIDSINNAINTWIRRPFFRIILK